MLLQYASSDLLNSSITDAGSGVHLFDVHTESFYITERIYHPLTGTQDTSVRPSRLLELNDISSGFPHLRGPGHHLQDPIRMTALRFQSGMRSKFVMAMEACCI
jgi:hypothetical protein